MTNDEAKVFTFELTVVRTVKVEAPTLGDATEQVWEQQGYLASITAAEATCSLVECDDEELLKVEHVATRYRRNG